MRPGHLTFTLGAALCGWGGAGLVVVGVDLEPGQGEGRRYSVVVVEDGKPVAKYSGVSLYGLIRILWELKPRMLALDNILELAPDKRELARLLSLLPSGTIVVQPTRLPDGRLVPLKRLAKLAGIGVVQGKLSPLKTALLVALLAEMGYGSALRFVEEKTKIVVARSRRLKHGGMSTRRYQRRVHAAILRAVRDIKKALDRRGLDYDLLFRKSGGGLESALFTVYAPRSALAGVVKPFEDTDVRIEIVPVYRSEASFEVEADSAGNGRFLIVGIDPGISIGVAAIDLKGRPVVAFSRRGIDRSDVIELIRQHGVPILLATDVTPAPDFVKKLASMLNIPLYEPPAPLSVEEKRSIFEAYMTRYPSLQRIADSHVRDALAAAIKAYRIHEGKLRQVESYLSKIELDVDVERIKAEVIRGISIAEAVEKAIEEILHNGGVGEYAGGRSTVRRGAGPGKASAVKNKLVEEVELLRAENMVLRKRIRELEERIESAEVEMRSVMAEFKDSIEREREVSALRERVRVLSSELEKLREEVRLKETVIEEFKSVLYDAARGKVIPAHVFDALSSSVISDIKALASAYGRFLVVFKSLDPVSFEKYGSLLSHYTLAIAVPRGHASKYKSLAEKYSIPILPLENYLVKYVGDIALLDSRVVLDAYLEKYKLTASKSGERRGLSVDALKKIIAEYRLHRARALARGKGEAHF